MSSQRHFLPSGPAFLVSRHLFAVSGKTHLFCSRSWSMSLSFFLCGTCFPLCGTVRLWHDKYVFVLRPFCFWSVGKSFWFIDLWFWFQDNNFAPYNHISWRKFRTNLWTPYDSRSIILRPWHMKKQYCDHFICLQDIIFLVLGQNNFCLKGILAYHRT